MSTPESHPDGDRERTRDRDRDRDYDRPDRPEKSNSKQKSANAGSKSKDLSHVPCKFFKVGGCTAGSSCPFSHNLPEPGQKETCAWFVKGNCKFGHKCALAHILPGQDMSMDRKNKKAAQQAAAAASGKDGDKGGREGKKGGKREGATSGPGAQGKNALLAGGSTAPTRILNAGPSASSTTGRPPMNLTLKASISPSAPAPPLQDSDFASFDGLDDMEDDHKSKSNDPSNHIDSGESAPASVPLPPSAPRSSSATVQNDFGPIGSPPNNRTMDQMSPTRLNGKSTTFSPGTSPRGPSHINGINLSSSPNTNQAGLPSSPFSAPGTQTTFRPSSYSASRGLGAGGVASSLGSGLAMMGGRRGWGDADGSATAGFSDLLSASVNQRRPSGLSGSVTRTEYDVSFEYDEYVGAKNLRRVPRNHDSAVDDGDLEDFIPGSLSELLTPEERNRRMSRSNSGQPGSGLPANANALKPGEGPDLTAGSGLGHRYSRSVPAPSLLGDIKSIWADTSAHPLPSSPSNHPTHRTTPSTASLASRFEGLNIGGGIDDNNLGFGVGSPSSIGMISPSNASAAFLPGFHQQYLAAKAKQAQQVQLGQGGQGGLARGMRGSSNPLYAGNNSGVPTNSIASNYLQPLGAGISGSPSSVTLHTHVHGNTQHTYRTTPSPFDLTQGLHQPQSQLQSQPHQQQQQQQHHHHQQQQQQQQQHRGGLLAAARPIPANGDQDDIVGPHVLSPSTRALQAHAPGQSLPQGLAAGLSRIHALPPMNIISPGTPGSAFMGGASGSVTFGTIAGAPPGSVGSVGGMGNGEWQSNFAVHQGHGFQQHQYQQQQMQQGGLGGMVPSGSPTPDPNAKKSYSAVASRLGSNTPTPGHMAPPGLTRNPAGSGGYAVVPQQETRARDDDDELFDMDG
ncbi:hypothetical protein FA15DRAFT_708549 [Coprinopsis marcescibilis]|uniref:C3H1-type domain-containing protein n=1 Tax=Coprinopsis marcescibilis TaxID=230819 RepID=A0A5C3KI64_COPMA|nr:hypothetical protein FA15DRAFT_708549 [Coprinopsis marcescibilis]